MKATEIVLLIVVAALGASVLSLWRQRTADHELIATLQNRLDSAVAASRGSAQAPPLAAPIVRADENASAEEAAEPVIPAVARRPTAKEGLEAAYARNSSPENIERMRAITRARMVYQYPDLQQVLALSSEEVSKLYDLLAQQELQRPVPDPARGETLSQVVARLLQENEAQIASMLGSRYPQWKAYKTELPSRLQVKDLAAVLKAGGMPLNEAQTGLLTSALISAQNSVYQMAGPVWSPEKRQILIDAASRYLGPDQLAAYRQMLERHQGTGTSNGFLLPIPRSGANSAPPTN